MVCLISISKAANADLFHQFPEASAWAVTSRNIGQFFDHCVIFIDGCKPLNAMIRSNLMVQVIFSPFTRKGTTGLHTVATLLSFFIPITRIPKHIPSSAS